MREREVEGHFDYYVTWQIQNPHPKPSAIIIIINHLDEEKSLMKEKEGDEDALTTTIITTSLSFSNYVRLGFYKSLIIASNYFK